LVSICLLMSDGDLDIENVFIFLKRLNLFQCYMVIKLPMSNLVFNFEVFLCVYLLASLFIDWSVFMFLHYFALYHNFLPLLQICQSIWHFLNIENVFTFVCHFNYKKLACKNNNSLNDGICANFWGYFAKPLIWLANWSKFLFRAIFNLHLIEQ